MSLESTPKFSKEEVEQYKNWLLPDVSDKLNTNKNNKNRDPKKHKATSRDETKALDESAGESVEIIEELFPSLTAEQLKAINDTAHNEGFDSGYLKGMEQGIEEGKIKGFDAGKEEGLTAAKQLVTSQCENLQHIINALLIPIESEQNQLQSIMLEMVSQLAKAVVLRELSLDSSHISHLVDSALQTLPAGADKFSLYVNPQDLNLVESHLADFKQHNDKQLLVHSDEALLPGGCRLETQQSIVDYSVEKRLQTIIDGFLHKRFADHSNKDDVGDKDTTTDSFDSEIVDETKLNTESPSEARENPPTVDTVNQESISTAAETDDVLTTEPHDQPVAEKDTDIKKEDEE